MKGIAIGLVSLLFLAACSNKDDKGAMARLTLSGEAYQSGKYEEAKAQIDTLRDLYPKAIEVRKEAIRLRHKIDLAMEREKLEEFDKQLQKVEREYQRLKLKVDSDKARYQATAKELTSLTLARICRDSIRVQFEVACQKIKFILKKQKEDK